MQNVRDLTDWNWILCYFYWFLPFAFGIGLESRDFWSWPWRLWP